MVRRSQFDLDSAGTKTFHVKRVKGSVDSAHTLDRDEVAGPVLHGVKALEAQT